MRGLESILPVDVSSVINQRFNGSSNSTLVAAYLTAAVTTNTMNFVLNPNSSDHTALSLREDDLRAYECAYFTAHENLTAADEIYDFAHVAALLIGYNLTELNAYTIFALGGVNPLGFNMSAFNISAHNLTASAYYENFYNLSYWPQTNTSNFNFSSGEEYYNISNVCPVCAIELSDSTSYLSCSYLINKTLPSSYSYSVRDLETLYATSTSTATLSNSSSSNQRRMLDEISQLRQKEDYDSDSISSSSQNKSIMIIKNVTELPRSFLSIDISRISNAKEVLKIIEHDVSMSKRGKKKILGRGPYTKKPRKCPWPDVDIYYINGLSTNRKSTVNLKSFVVRAFSWGKKHLRNRDVLDIHRDGNVVGIFNPSKEGYLDLWTKVSPANWFEDPIPEITSNKLDDILDDLGKHSKHKKKYDSLSKLKKKYDAFGKAKSWAQVLASMLTTYGVLYQSLEHAHEVVPQIIKMAYDSIRSGKRVFIIGWSDGNYYMNKAYRSMSKDAQGYVGLYSIATPDSRIGTGKILQVKYNDYTTRRDDHFIKYALRPPKSSPVAAIVGLSMKNPEKLHEIGFALPGNVIGVPFLTEVFGDEFFGLPVTGDEPCGGNENAPFHHHNLNLCYLNEGEKPAQKIEGKYMLIIVI